MVVSSANGSRDDAAAQSRVPPALPVVRTPGATPHPSRAVVRTARPAFGAPGEPVPASLLAQQISQQWTNTAAVSPRRGTLAYARAARPVSRNADLGPPV